MKRIPWKARLECPQCGAGVDQEPSDPVFRCPYCKTSLYMASNGPLRYRLGDSAPKGGPLIYLPFWRFVGMRYLVLENRKIHHSLLDATVPAFTAKASGHSLGIAPQVQPLGVWTCSHPGIEPEISPRRSMEAAQERADEMLGMAFLFRRLVAETQCLLYAPFVLKDHNLTLAIGNSRPLRMEDCVLQRLQGLLSKGSESTYKLEFIPLICPECASPLPPHAGALGLHCPRCSRLWFVKTGHGLVSARYRVILTGRETPNTVFLPFWQMELAFSDLGINNREDLLKLAAPYWKAPPSWKDQPVTFLIPAFKLNPRLYLNIARRLSLSQSLPDYYQGQTPQDAEAEPVKVPLREAAQAAKVVLARILMNNRKAYPLVGKAKVKVITSSLTYVPYTFNGREFVNPWTGTSIHSNALSLGRQL